MSDRLTAWAAVLDELERSVADAQRSLAAGGTESYAAWQPPADLGPLPLELADQASELVERQRRTLDEGAPVLAAARGALDYTRRARRAAVPATHRAATSVYLDVTA
ncbi:hypothetical protein SAMN04487968_105182 [Nocardioides terrae]|uniref:Uncharacterized protein n=1 Tax=Nocardioides terrae TaxID=574651 RepID=A0A1I1IE19_9ACTN|nr:hypothetical protein [Nocardioides terrae]SFC32478.1 hypothetical protein SAMN04487968_105182 [Nocardioides terrae]